MKVVTCGFLSVYGGFSKSFPSGGEKNVLPSDEVILCYNFNEGKYIFVE
jgi:hypothetical protein